MIIYDEINDFEDYYDKPNKIICVFFMPRSGSNWLAEEMKKTEMLGYPLEYFSVANINRLRNRLPELSVKNVSPILKKRTSPNGVFSFKWNSNYGPLNTLNLEPDYFIYIDRLDWEAQAKSFCIAEKTKDWIGTNKTAYVLLKREIENAAVRISEMRVATLGMLNGKSFFSVFYEDLENDINAVILNINDFICEIDEDINNS